MNTVDEDGREKTILDFEEFCEHHLVHTKKKRQRRGSKEKKIR